MKKEQIEKLRHLSRKLVRELGMLQLDDSSSNTTPGHWHALIEIDKEPGITISKLGNLLLMSPSKISRLIKSLVKDKLVELKSGTDKREKYLYIKTSGKKAIGKIDEFSQIKVKGAFGFLNDDDISQIIHATEKYALALEKSRLLKDQIKITTISTSRTLRKQIINMIADIQKNEFSIPITPDTNINVLKAEQNFYYNNSYNFWYAADHDGKIIGSIGLKKIDAKKGEIKKFFVVQEYRSKGIAQKLINNLIKTSAKHGFKTLFLGTASPLKAAHKFYKKYGFKQIKKTDLPAHFEICSLDSMFFKGEVADLFRQIS